MCLQGLKTCKCNTAVFGGGSRCSANPGTLATSPLQPVLLTKLFSCDRSLGLIYQNPLSTQGLQGTCGSRLSCLPQELLSEVWSCTGCQPCTPSLLAVWVPWEGPPVSCLCPVPPESLRIR